MSSVGIMASGVAGVTVPPGTNTLTEPFTDLTGWTSVGTTSLVAGRTGNAAQANGSSGELSKTLAASDTYVTTGVACFITNAATNYYAPGIITLYAGTTAIIAVTMVGAATNGLCVTRGTSNTNIVCQSAVGAVATFGVWHYIELQARIDATLGFATLKLNGATIASATNVNTGTSAITKIALGCGAPGNVLKFDDLYVSLGSACVFQGDHNVPARIP